ncbi:OmpA family protein [Alkalimarinus sediminis]|uniref:OmpA family protein n=1 Tax=Alkalimarinus sediminis TaxID=1632866 RepID=A0A9E8HGF0_9ALTE|nr:OmpA family protein [Alkalimarinus sediminis]UZW73750.1 OmpA family protein [Alkalimarinus sediminis]
MKKLLSGIALLAATAPSVNAEELDSGFYIFPSIGYFLLDDDRNADNTATASFAVGYQFNNRFSTEAAYGIFDTESNVTGKDIDGSYYHVDAVYHLNDDDTLQPYVLAGIGNMDLGIPNSENDAETSYNAGAGFKRHLTENLSLRAEARMFYGNDSNNKDALLNFGLVYLFGGSSSSYAEESSADDSNYDSDGDGIMDSQDQCPNTATGAEVDGSGCVIVAAVVAPKDSDNDGVADSADQCPNTPAGRTVDANGCELDADGDSVVDGADKCPETPEGAKVDETGCSLAIAETITQTLHVKFPNNSSIVPSSAKPEIKELSVFMTSYPATKVTIEGHTDSSGEAKYNQYLSEKRAKAIAKILVEDYGIESSRVDAIGYGEEKPIADNTSAEGRKQNRRVEAVIEATK